MNSFKFKNIEHVRNTFYNMSLKFNEFATTKRAWGPHY